MEPTDHADTGCRSPGVADVTGCTLTLDRYRLVLACRVKEKHRMQALGSGVPRKMLRPEREKVTQDWPRPRDPSVGVGKQCYNKS